MVAGRRGSRLSRELIHHLRNSVHHKGCSSRATAAGGFPIIQARFGGDPNIGMRLCIVMIVAGLEVAWLTGAANMLDQRATDPNGAQPVRR